MNYLSSNTQNNKVDEHKMVLPFYRDSDLNLAPEEISIDKFEEYAKYRMNCTYGLYRNVIYSILEYW